MAEIAKSPYAGAEEQGGSKIAKRRGERGGTSPARQTLTWGALTFLLALSAGAIGYLSAGATTQAKPASPRLAAPAAPGLVDLVGIYRSGYSDGARAGGRKGYAKGRIDGRRAEARETKLRYRQGGLWYRAVADRGRRAGARRALERFGFSGNGFYLVGVRDGGGEVDASHGPLPEGRAYRVCRDGSAVCAAARPAPR